MQCNQSFNGVQRTDAFVMGINDIKMITSESLVSRSCHESLIFNLRIINTPTGAAIKISNNSFLCAAAVHRFMLLSWTKNIAICLWSTCM